VFRVLVLTVASISTMTGFAAYFQDGLALALHLANLRSACRRGFAASHREPPEEAGVRVTEPQALRRLSLQMRTIVTEPDQGAAATLLNRLLAEHDAAPQLAPDGGHWRLHLHPTHSTNEALDAVKAASGLAALMDQHGWTTLKVCAASRCEDVFQDQSRNRTRRYCSRTCANRINAEHSRANRQS